MLANRTNLRVSRFLASYIAIGDEITFPTPTEGVVGAELYIVKDSPSSGRDRCLYQAPIGYVSQPRLDKRNQHFVSAQVQQNGLGISAIFMQSRTLRGYFYGFPNGAESNPRPSLYEKLRIPATASPAELRVAFKLRNLELAGGSRGDQIALERAFNILAQPELRACYDTLLADREAPAVFPDGGFGSLLVAGERSRDGPTFFANRILAFSPERRSRRFHFRLRQCDFYEDRALCRDVRRKLEFWLDPALLHAQWDTTCNQWKHLLASKMEVNGTFVQCGKFSKRGGGWELALWETALPSRLLIQTPSGIEQQLETAKTSYRRFGQYSRALDQIRLCLEHRAIEKAELQRIARNYAFPVTSTSRK